MIRTRLSILVALLCAAMLVLQGCGGDDGNNVEQDLRDQIAELEGQLSDAQDAQAAAEATKAAADEAAADAMAAQMAAKMERDDANAAKGAAVQAQMDAEASEAAAVQAQMDAEAAQATAEAAQTAAEQAQAVAEAAQAAAEAAQMEAEGERDQAVGDAAAAEARRDEAIANEVRAQNAQEDAEEALAAANANIMDLEGQLADTKAEVMVLAGMLDTANANAMALQGQLDAANEQVAMLMAQIGSADDPESLTAMLAAANAEVMRLQGALDMANADVTRLTGELADANTAKENAEANLVTAVEDKVKAETARDDALADLKTAQDDLKTAQDDLDAANKRADDAEEERDRLQAMLDDDQDDMRDDEMRAYMVSRAKGIMAAMMDRSDSAPNVDVEYDGGVKIEVDDIDGAGTAPPAIPGFTARTFTRNRPAPVGGSDSVYVYTDITAPQAMEFGDVHLQPASPGDTPPTTVGLGATTDNPGMASLAKSSAFPSTDNTTTSFDDGDSADGTYDGVAGDFDCGGAGCTVAAAVDSKGVVTLTFAGPWTFDPDDPEDTVMVADADFLTFGYWLYKPDEAEDPHLFDTFAMGSQAFTAAAPSNLTGTSTYRGNAAGKYVTRNLVAETAEIGLFTAKARLTANFTSAAVSGLDAGSITGAITDFVAGDGTQLDGWSVTLDAAGTTTGSAGPPAVATRIADAATTSAMIGGNAAGTGTWAATFHGTGRNDGAPGHV